MIYIGLLKAKAISAVLGAVMLKGKATKIPLLLSLLVVIFILSVAVIGGCGNKEAEEPGWIYVVFQNEVNPLQAEEVITRLGYAEQTSTYSTARPLIVQINAPPGKTTQEMIEEFRAEPLVMVATTDVSVLESIPPYQGYVPGRIVVLFYPNTTDQQIREVVERHNCTVDTIFGDKDYIYASVILSRDANEDQAVEDFNKETLVQEAKRMAEPTLY